jgi:3-oxoacyl-[acyl-carrier-protein] synthase-1
MQQYPLKIAGLGMVSCLGVGAELNATAMRCGYDGFTQTVFNQPYMAKKQVGAPIETELQGSEKITQMLITVIQQSIADLPPGYENLPVLFCLPDREVPGIINDETTFNNILDRALEQIELGTLHPESSAFWQQRCGFVTALGLARQLIYQDDHHYVLIVGLDSLLNRSTLAYYTGGIYGEDRRLLGEEHSNGFIPGEAACAVLLSSTTGRQSEVVIAGIGEAHEAAVIGNEELVLKGQGLSAAINQASDDAGIAIHETAFRIASVSGEDYFFTEAALAHYKTLRKKLPAHPLWHPADSVGEVGAAIGGIMTITAYYALTKGYVRGEAVLCHISNDGTRRGAFIIQYQQQGN